MGRPLEEADRLYRSRREVEKGFEYLKWVEEIPDLDFPSGWAIRPIPPFSGAIVRFLVRRSDTPKGHRVSVYLDCYGHLGAALEPYWEIQPGTEEGDANRVYLEETDELMESIGAGLNHLATIDESKYRSRG